MLTALQAAIDHIPAPQAEAPFRAHLDTLTKPLGSLGRLEDLAVQLQALGLRKPSDLRAAAYVFAADHGIAAEGVSLYPAEVTRQMVLNFLAGGAAINVLARLHGAEVHVVNAGVAGSLPDALGLRNTPVRAGSRNMRREPAMSAEELDGSLSLGLTCADEAYDLGYTIVAAGEMGIGNTSSAAAITAALTGRLLAEVTGRGTGLDDTARRRKLDVLERTLELHSYYLGEPAETLRRLGGLEIAALAGFMIGCAGHGIATLLDGFISSAAGACALAMTPALRHYLFAGHQSEEPGHRILLAHMGLTPILSLGMRLGEGTGAVLALPLLRSALAISTEMATFSSAGVSEAGA